MFTFGLTLGTFFVGSLFGFATAAVLAATRQAELHDLCDKASRDAGRAERELTRLRARCKREFGAEWLHQPTAPRR